MPVDVHSLITLTTGQGFEYTTPSPTTRRNKQRAKLRSGAIGESKRRGRKASPFCVSLHYSTTN